MGLDLKRDDNGLLGQRGDWYNVRDITRQAKIEKITSYTLSRVLVGTDCKGNSYDITNAKNLTTRGIIPQKYERETIDILRKRVEPLIKASKHLNNEFVKYGDYLRYIGRNVKDGKKLIISGQPFTMAEPMAVVLAKTYEEQERRNFVYCTPGQLLARKGYSFTDDAVRYQELACRYPLLVLAHLGTEDDSKRNIAALYEMLLQREYNRLSSIIVTSCDLQELTKRYGANFVDLLKENTTYIDVRYVTKAE